MFFVFPLLFLSVYVSDTNNFVLKNESQGDGPNVKQNDKDLVFQDVQNDSPVVPTSQSVLHVINNFTKTQNSNPKSNKLTRKLSDGIPIKRHIQDEEGDEEDIPSMFKSTTSSIATSTIESKRKWPVVEFLSHSYDSVENTQYFDELKEKEFPLFHDVVNKSKIIDFPPKYNNRYFDLRKNLSKEKPVGLRSIPQQKFPGPCCEENDKCVCRPKILNKCTRSSIIKPLKNVIPAGAPKPKTTPNTSPQPPGSQGFDMGYLAMGVPMGVPVGIPAGYPGGYLPGYPGGFPAGYPAAIPAGPVVCPPGCYQEGSKQKKPNKKPSDDYLYYENDDGDDDYHEDDNEYDKIHNFKGKKEKYKDVFIDIDYDIEDSCERKPNWNSKCRDNTEDLATDIFNDIRKSEKIIKKCYCCSASCSGIKFGIIFFYSILVTFSSSNFSRIF